MATPIKRIEKDFLLKVLYDEQLPLMLFFNRINYTLVVDKPPKESIILKPNEPIQGLKIGDKINLIFDYHSQVISFGLIIQSIKDTLITAEAPEFLYKNLARSFSRVHSPADLKVEFTFHGDRFNLSFPKVQEYEQDEVIDFMDKFDPLNIKELVNQLASWVQESATGYKLVIFKGNKPQTMEEKVIAETGKTLFLPSTQSEFPKTDPYPKKRIVTEDIFKRFLESSGVDVVYVEDTVKRFLENKKNTNVYSDIWVPILFQEYVIGYIHAWIDSAGKPPFDYGVVDTLYQFGKILAYSLKEHGYFAQGKIKKEPFQGRIVDISASGLLFAYPHSALSSALLVDSELDVRLVTPKRTIKTASRIVRRYKDLKNGFYGVRFLDIAPEDMRYLFEYIYGRAFTDADASFLAGKV